MMLMDDKEGITDTFKNNVIENVDKCRRMVYSDK
jgi:hypothetical protein